MKQVILSDLNIPGVAEVNNYEIAPFEAAPPLLRLIMKGTIFRSSLETASSTSLQLGEKICLVALALADQLAE